MEFEAFTRSLGDCQTVAGATSIFRAACGELGLDAFAYLGFATSTMDCSPSRVITTYPVSWRERYFEQGYDRLDPVMRMAEETFLPFSWGICGGEVPLDGPAQMRMFEEAADVGIRYGLTVPVRDRAGRLCMVSACASDEHWQQRQGMAGRHDFHLMAHYFHASVMRLDGLARVSRGVLSSRERACLSWAAQGKNADDTGVILGISRRTVRFHLGNVKHKLGASTIAEAVAMAASGGLISRLDS